MPTDPHPTGALDLEALIKLREEAALEAFEPRPLHQPWPAQTAFAKAMYDAGPALLDRLQAVEGERDGWRRAAEDWLACSGENYGRAEAAEAALAAARETLDTAGVALDIADRLIERGYGMDTPKEWNTAFRSVAEVNHAAIQPPSPVSGER